MTNTWDAEVLKGLLQFSSDMICTIDVNGLFLHVSAASQAILGYAPSELEGKKFIDYVSPLDIPKTKAVTQEIIKEGKKVVDFKNRYLTKSGKSVGLTWSVVFVEEQQSMYCVARLNQPVADESSTQNGKVQFLRSLINQGADMQAVLNENCDFLYTSGATEKVLGCKTDALVDFNAFKLVHPEDLAKAQEAWEMVLASGQGTLSECRVQHSDGNWRWLELHGINYLDNAEVGGIVISARDITERVIDREKLKEREQCFRALFLNNPDLIIYQNKEGLILDANPAFLKYFQAEKEELLQMQLIDLLPEEVKPICWDSMQKAVTGEVVNYEVSFSLADHPRQVFDVTKIPVFVNGVVTGVFSRLRDITQISISNLSIKQQIQQLASVFESITDAFFFLDKEYRLSFVNKEFERILKVNREELIGQKIMDVFPEEVDGTFFKHYRYALQNREAVHFEAYLERLDIWLEVKAFPSEEGLSVYFADITDKINNKRELEKLSLVASKTINGVVITDANGYVDWVNEAFCRITGYNLEEVKGKKPGSVLQGPETDPETVEILRQKLALGESFNVNIINYRKSGEKFWLSMDITAIRDKDGKIIQYIAILKDVTSRKEIEYSQKEMTKDLFQQNRDLQQFTYIISHNLRAPVANALGLAELLTGIDKSSPLFEQSLSHLKKTVFKMDTVLRDLNMVLSIRDRQDVQDQEDVPLAGLLEQVLQSFEEQLINCGAHVKLEVGKDLTVQGNKAYLYSIFYNLLSNSIKYRSQKRALQIIIKCYYSEERGVAVSFSDNGTGFDLEKAKKDLFKMYKRFHKNKNGRGIGLFLVKTHVESMGGQIEVTSQIEGGTRFLIYLNSQKA
ncbi:PAS domain-containing sensor histidine kinase [Rufibacter roseus]|uniref:histidine kinase n=1 Tax=Rufibacter roseus TaxID=1567108 RepID=A0ABW2DU81_9BACT|nr:PAS domain-containing sensor histidine kinase [Rufibacter roseus]